MAERPEDLNLPNSVVSKIIKEAVCIFCADFILIIIPSSSFNALIQLVYLWELA